MKFSPCLGAFLFATLPIFAQSGGDQPEGAVVIRGELAKSDPQDAKSGGYRKVHVIELKTDSTYRFQVESAGNVFRPYLRIEDEQGMALEQASASDGKPAELTFSPLVDGKYTLVVTSVANGDTGNYALSVSRGEGAATVQFNGMLANTDPLDNVRQGCRQKVYVHKMSAGRTYTIDLEGQFDTYIRVENSKGTNLAEDDDGGDGLNSRLTFRPTQNDSYRVIVTSCGQGAVGPYKLRIHSTGAEKLVLSTQSALTNQDPLDRVRQGSHCKIFTVKMDAGRAYTIDLQSVQFDSYLRLEDANGNNLAQDDDSGGNLNSRITFSAPQAGVYRVVATTLGGGSTGNFSLSVRQN